MAESGSVQSVARAVNLIEELARAGGDGELALSELARRTALHPPTAHRLVYTLVQRQWVVQNPATSAYRLSHKLLSIVGDLERRTARLRTAVRRHLEAMRDATGESTNLVVLDGLVAVYIDQVPSLRPIRMFTQIGARIPAHASGAGKAMLAFGPAAVLDKLELGGLEPLTPRTITNRGALERELERVRRRRYAIDNEEYETGVVCVATPILAPDGVALAAISVSAPVARMPPAKRVVIGRQLMERGPEISHELGYTPRPEAG